MSAPDTAQDHTDTERPEGAEEPEQRPGDEAPTGWHLYNGKAVVVQLFEPYVAGMSRDGAITTPVLEGIFRILPGAAPGSLLFVLNARHEGLDHFISMQPGDVKHITYVAPREQSRIVAPE